MLRLGLCLSSNESISISASSTRFFSSRPRRLYSREEQNKYIELQNTRKLSRLYGKLPIPKMHRRTRRTSYIPFLLSLETRLDVILVRIRFCETIPQARQLISHRKVFVNNGVVAITHFKLSPGDIISFEQNKDFPKTQTKDVGKGSGGEGGILGNSQGGHFSPFAEGLASRGVASRSFSTLIRGRGLDAEIPRLMPAGELACTSVHGANSLLDIDSYRRACANRVAEICSSVFMFQVANRLTKHEKVSCIGSPRAQSTSQQSETSPTSSTSQ